MTFDFLNCSQCKTLMTFPNPHPEIKQHMDWLIQKKDQMEGMAVQRAKHEGIDKDERLKIPGDRFFNDLK